MISVVSVGIATTVQDAGRPGLARFGIGRSGAADSEAYRLANRLVGNDDGAAVLETSGALVLQMSDTALIAVTGARCDVTIEHRRDLEAVASLRPIVTAAGHAAPTAVPAGATVRVGVSRHGLRIYVAVRGGVAVAPVLGSRSRDTLAALGPEIVEGSTLPIGADPGTPITVDVAPQRARDAVVRVLPGPRRDWFTADAWHRISSGTYVVEATTNRVGARLSGPTLERLIDKELPSEGLVLGAIQVPPNLQPIVMLADHPVTGGYPVIAVVHPDDVQIVAQAAPGTALRLVAARAAR
jgi:biotin-dependent carboxylase-like uncharacterized protein